jgi:hypothetical protein
LILALRRQITATQASEQVWIFGLKEAAEQMGITRPGKLAAVIGPAGTAISVAEAFADIAEIRKRVKPI